MWKEVLRVNSERRNINMNALFETQVRIKLRNTFAIVQDI